MQTNTPFGRCAHAEIRAQYPHESEERHRKRFIEMVRNSDPEVREEIVMSLFAVYLSTRAYTMSALLARRLEGKRSCRTSTYAAARSTFSINVVLGLSAPAIDAP